MTVAELIEKLRQLPPDLEVYYQNDEFGTYHKIGDPKVTPLVSCLVAVEEYDWLGPCRVYSAEDWDAFHGGDVLTGPPVRFDAVRLD